MWPKTDYRFVSMLLLILTGNGSQTVAVETVEAIRISTGIVTQQVYLSPSARFACIFGQAPRTERIASSIQSPPQELVVVDLKNQEVIKRCPSAGWTRAAVVSEREVLWAIADEKSLRRLRFDSTSDLEEIQWETPVNELFAVGPQHIGMVNVNDSYRGTIAVYSRETLSKLDPHPLNGTKVSCNRRKTNAVVELGDSTLWVNDRILEEKTGTNRCFTLTGREPPQLGKVRMREVSFPSYEYFGDAYWRRRVDKQRIEQFAGETQMRVRAEYVRLSKTHPLLARLQKSRGKNSLTYHLEVEFQDLVHGQILGAIKLPSTVKANSGQLTRQKAMRVEGNVVLVIYWDELFITRLPEQFRQGNLLVPLRLIYPSIPVGDLADPLEFQLSAKGGEPPFRFDVQSKVPGVTVDNKTGKVEVDFKVGWKTFCDAIQKKAHPFYQGNRNSAYMNNMRICEQLGMKVAYGKFLVSLPVEFVVTDQSGQRDRILISLLSNASLDEYENLTKKKESSFWDFFGN